MTVCTPAKNRYNRRVIVLSLIYSALLIGAVYLFKHHIACGPIAWIVGILPALPIVAIFGAIGVYIVEETDEYLRMLLVRQTLYASAITLSITTVWGFLESFGLVGHIEAYYASVLWFAGLGVGTVINRITEGTWSS
jgi:xanthosine utilization system XapX-like protein